MQQVHPFCYVERHPVPLFERKVDGPLFMQQGEQTASEAVLGDYKDVPLVSTCANEEDQVGVSYFNQRLYFTLKLDAQMT